MSFLARFKRKVKDMDPTSGSSGFGAPLHLVFTQRDLPRGGMGSVSFDTLALPRTTPIGNGVANKMQFKTTPSCPVMFQRQGFTIDRLGNPGIPSGQIVTQPLIDTQSAAALGIIVPGIPSHDIPTGQA